MAQNTKDVKKRNWAFVAYPESMPENWLEILQQTGLPIAISPLHDKDINANEEEKKPHYHVICCFSRGTVRFTQADKVAKSINGTIPIPLDSIRGYYRYFTHKDNPEKYQYDEKDIKCLNGFAITDYVEITKSEVSKIKKSIREIIRGNSFDEYSDLMDYLDILDNQEYIEVAENNTLHFNAYLKSKKFKGGLKMAYPKKHEQSTTRGLRISCDINEFLRENFTSKSFTANDFINMLIQNSDEYKRFIAKKQSENNEPKLDLL